MKFVGFNLKEPKVSNRYGNILDDLGFFIGIVTRKSIINYLYFENKKQSQ